MKRERVFPSTGARSPLTSAYRAGARAHTHERAREAHIHGYVHQRRRDRYISGYDYFWNGRKICSIRSIPCPHPARTGNITSFSSPSSGVEPLQSKVGLAEGQSGQRSSANVSVRARTIIIVRVGRPVRPRKRNRRRCRSYRRAATKYYCIGDNTRYGYVYVSRYCRRNMLVNYLIPTSK